MEDPIKILKDQNLFEDKFGSFGRMIVSGDDACAIEFILANDESLDIRRPLNPVYRLTALHLAARFNRVEIATILLKHSIRKENKDLVNCNEGFLGFGTPLHIAAEFGCADVIRILLNHGADINAIRRRDRSFSGADPIVGRRTALALALDAGFLHIARELRSRGARDGKDLTQQYKTPEYEFQSTR